VEYSKIEQPDVAQIWTMHGAPMTRLTLGERDHFLVPIVQSATDLLCHSDPKLAKRCANPPSSTGLLLCGRANLHVCGFMCEWLCDDRY
jgi:hypothetical protein